LLINQNYSLTILKTGDGRIVPDSVKIFGTGSVVRFEVQSPAIRDNSTRIKRNQASPQDDPMKNYQKAWNQLGSHLNY